MGKFTEEARQKIKVYIVMWIRIQEGKKTLKKENVKKFHVLKCMMFSLEGCRLHL
jgi:hypothetical protein